MVLCREVGLSLGVWLLVRLLVLNVDAVLCNAEKVSCSGLGLFRDGTGLLLDGVGLCLDNTGLSLRSFTLPLDVMESVLDIVGLSRNRVGLLLGVLLIRIDVGLILEERVIVTAFRRRDPRTDARCRVSASIINSKLLSIAVNR